MVLPSLCWPTAHSRDIVFTYRFGAILLLERVLFGHINQFAKIHRAHKHTQLAAGQSCAQIEIIHPVTERKWPVKTHFKQQQQQKLQRCMGNPVSRTPSSRHHTVATCYRSRIDLHPRSSALSEVEEEGWLRVGSVGSGNNLLPLFLLPPCVLRVETVDRFFLLRGLLEKCSVATLIAEHRPSTRGQDDQVGRLIFLHRRLAGVASMELHLFTFPSSTVLCVAVP